MYGIVLFCLLIILLCQTELRNKNVNILTFNINYADVLNDCHTGIWPPEYRSFFEHLETGVKTTSKHV